MVLRKKHNLFFSGIKKNTVIQVFMEYCQRAQFINSYISNLKNIPHKFDFVDIEKSSFDISSFYNLISRVEILTISGFRYNKSELFQKISDPLIRGNEDMFFIDKNGYIITKEEEGIEWIRHNSLNLLLKVDIKKNQIKTLL